jgi:hypothetical protein
MAKLHIEGARNRPEAIRHYLDFIDRRDYDSLEAVMDDIYRETSLDPVDTKNMQTTLWKLGLVTESDRQELTELGRDLVDVLLYNEQVFYELLHFVYATAYHRDPSPDRAISWAYYHICGEYRRRAPVQFHDVKQEVIESVMSQSEQSSDAALSDPGPLSSGSITNYSKFIKLLDPVVYNDGEFGLRTFAKKELVLATIDHLYRTDVDAGTREYGDLIELSGDAVQIICTILLLQEESLAEVIEHVASMDSRLEVKADYELRVRLTESVELNDLS